MKTSDQKVSSQFQVKGAVKNIKGSILTPHHAGLRFILSLNNMAGKPESPLYPVFEKKWRKVREEARGWYTNKTGAYKLGAINTTAVQSDTWVIHMLCQDDQLKTDVGAVETCLQAVCKLAKYEKATVHVSSLLTDAIPELDKLLQSELISQGVSVCFYQEPKV